MAAARTRPRARPQRAACLVALGLAGLLPVGARAQADPALLQALQDPSFKVRVRAAVVIGKKQMREAAPALKKALGDEHDAVRAAAARALGAVGDQSARPLLAALLAHPSEAVQKATTKGLALLDGELGGARRYLVVVDPPMLPAGVSQAHGQRLLGIVRAELQRHPAVVSDQGEAAALAKGGLAEHLQARGLTGIRVQPKVVKLQEASTGVVCKVSVMTLTMPANRMEFAGNGEGEAEVDGELDPDDRVEVEVQLIEAAGQAAAEEVGGFLTRRTGP